MEPTRSRLTRSLVVATLISMPWTAWANDGTPPWIFELVQQGGGVGITLAIVTGGEPGMAESYTLTRTDPEGSATVFEARQFTEADVEMSREECRGGGTGDEECDGNPTECIDCDGDGTPECFDPSQEDWCDSVNYIHLIDDCVPPGAAEYVLSLVEAEWDEDTATITVEDVGQDCSGGDGDGDSDGDGDGDDTTSGDDSGGCTASASSPSSTAPIVALLMLVLGLAAMQAGPGRRR